MTTNHRLVRARAALGTSAVALALATAFPHVAFAQSSSPVAADDEEGTIVVTGFRASLESAARAKRNAEQIVESVTAEDIGKLPDASIAESIARLPGLTSQRLSGRSNVISIRGLGPDLSMTLLNGREQTTTGDARAAEFDQYPSEVVNQVLIYKSPTASLIGQGLAGTVDIRTIRPLDAGRRIIAVGGRGAYNDLGKLNSGSSEFGFRVNGSFVDQFADDTIGLSLAASYVDEPYQIQEFNAWGYAGAGTTADPALIGGSKSYVTSTKLKRLGVAGTLQFRPQPELTITVDGFYSNFEDDSLKRGIELPLGFGGGFNVQAATNRTAAGNQVISGTFPNVRGVVRNDVNERKADLYSLGYNLDWRGDDGWSAFFDIGYSRTDRNELILESYAGTGFNGDDAAPGFPLGTSRADNIGFRSTDRGTVFSPTLNYSDPNLIRLTDPLGWGGGTVPQAGYFNNRIVDDELKQIRLQVQKSFDDSFIAAIKVGLGYTDRDKGLVPDEAFVRLPGTATSAAIPAGRLLSPTNLSYLGLGPIVSYDPRALIADGVLVLEQRAGNVADILAKRFTVKEDLMQAYLQADIRQPLGAATLTGNIGGQIVLTKQSSSGTNLVGGTPQAVTFGDDYVDFLPSINLALELPGQFIIRAAASRQIQRPRIDDMRLALNLSYDTTLGLIRSETGNPYLRPYRANAVDLNLEKYFSGGGFVAAQLFYKDLKEFIFTDEFFFDYSALPRPPGTPPGAPAFGILKGPVNTSGGRILGAEISANVPFGSIISALDGFGVTGGVGYTDTKVTNAQGVQQAIPGYSEWTASGTAYFEKGGFSVRGSVRYRSDFLGELSTFGGARGNRQALGETIIDAQIGYDFKDIGPLSGLSVFVQGQNLTDERFKTVANLQSPLQVIDYQTYGRGIYVGASLKF